MESVNSRAVWQNFMITKTENIPVSWIIEGLIPAQAITLLTGWRGSFKTYLSLGISVAVSVGAESFLGRRSERMPVFYVNRDNPQPVFTSRFREFPFLNEHNQNFAHWSLRHRSGAPPKLDTERFDDYWELAEKYKPLMIFDSLPRFHSGDENSTKDMATIFEKFRELTTFGASVLVLHNTGKDKKGARGVSAIEDGVDIMLDVSAKQNHARRQDTTLTLTITKDRLAGSEGEHLRLRPVPLPGGKFWFHVLNDSRT
jgi:RecA-family ATPase